MTTAQLSPKRLLNLSLQQEEKIVQQAEKITLQEQRIVALENQLRLMLSKQYGSKADNISPDQLKLFDGLEIIEDPIPEDSEEDTITVKYQRKRGKRKPIDPALERRPIHYELPEAQRQCPCGGELKEISRQTSEQYEYIPAQVVVLEHIQHQYACPCCKENVVLAPKPTQALPKSNAGPGLLAHISTTKFVDAVPLHRQEKQLERLRIYLGRTTMARCMIKLSSLWVPLLNLMEDAIRAGPLIQCDETPFQVLKEIDRKPTSLSYMWVRRGGVPGQEVVLFHYEPSRASSVVRMLFADYQGYVQCDGYSAYHCLESEKITLVGCMAHAKRKFNDALKSVSKKEQAQKTKAAVALSYFKKLYSIERDQKKSSDQLRYQTRQQDAVPILNEFKAWLGNQTLIVLPKSPLGKAVSYTLNQWPKLIRYCEDGLIPIDNNADERAIRPFAIGRRNWLFSTSPEGAHTNARFYGLIETCKLHGHEPYAYLKTIIKELPLAETIEAYELLLPWNLDVATVREKAREF